MMDKVARKSPEDRALHRAHEEVQKRHAAVGKAVASSAVSENNASVLEKRGFEQALERATASKGKKHPNRKEKGPLGAESDEHFIARMVVAIKRSHDNPAAAGMYERIAIKELQRRGRSESEAKAELMHRMAGL